MHLRSLAAIATCAAAIGPAACGGEDETTSRASSTTTAPTTGEETTGDIDTSDLPEASALRKQFDEQLLQILTTTQGLSRSQAECAVNELETRVTDDEIQAAIAAAAETGQSPQDLIDEAFDAGAECSKR